MAILRNVAAACLPPRHAETRDISRMPPPAFSRRLLCPVAITPNRMPEVRFIFCEQVTSVPRRPIFHAPALRGRAHQHKESASHAAHAVACETIRASERRCRQVEPSSFQRCAMLTGAHGWHSASDTEPEKIRLNRATDTMRRAPSRKTRRARDIGERSGRGEVDAAGVEQAPAKSCRRRSRYATMRRSEHRR